jgi:hypothetical protein
VRALGLVLTLPVFIFPGVALAGDLEQAQQLASQGKLDEAEKLLDAAIPGLQGKERRDARRLHAEVLGRRPERSGFERAVKEYGALASEDADDVESRAALYEIYHERGSRLAAAAARVEDGDAYRREAALTFKEGADFLEKEWSALEAIGTPAADRALVACGFYLPRCVAALARLEGTRTGLTRAVELWNRYNMLFGNEPEGFEAAADMAEALLELGQLDQASIAIESALAVPETLTDIFERASLVQARILLARGDAAKALAATEKALGVAKATGDADGTLGRLLSIEHADALGRLGKAREAALELEKIAEADTQAVGDLALERLASLQGASAAVSSARALHKMEEALGRGQGALALVHGRMARASARHEGSLAAEAAALEGIARAYEAKKRPFEAAIAYEEAARLPSAPRETSARSALALVRCCEERRARDPGPFSDAECRRALFLLEERDAAAKRGLAPFLLGKQLQEESRFAEAARSYDQVEGSLESEAGFLSACCLYAAAKGAPDVLPAIEARLRRLIPRLPESDRERALALLGEVLLQRGKPGEVALVLSGTSTVALQYRAIALVRLGDRAGAEPLVDELLRRPSDHRTAAACRELAVASVQSGSATPRLAPVLAAWLEDAHDALPVANASFAAALSVLGLSERGGFLMDLKGATPNPDAKPLLAVASRAYERALATARGGSGRWKLLACRAQSLAFAGDWEPARAAFTELLTETKLLDDERRVSPEVVAREPLLLAYLLDAARCDLEADTPDRARERAAAVIDTAREGTRVWWQAVLLSLEARDRAGTAEELKTLKVELRGLERRYPELAAAGDLAPELLALAKKVGAF